MREKRLYQRLLTLILLASLLALAAAYAAQYIFGLKPCHLCLWQRVPYDILIVVSIVGSLQFSWFRKALWVCMALLMIEAGLAGYHMSVEKHWIAGPSGCTAQAASSKETAEDFLAKIKAAPVVACDQPAWNFHGLTMATLNLFYALGLGGITFAALRRKPKRSYYG